MTVIWLEIDKTSVNFKVKAHGRISRKWKKNTHTLQYSDSNNDINSNHIYLTLKPKGVLPINI